MKGDSPWYISRKLKILRYAKGRYSIHRQAIFGKRCNCTGDFWCIAYDLYRIIYVFLYKVKFRYLVLIRDIYIRCIGYMKVH